MKFIVEKSVAKNGEDTLKINGFQLYSNYHPVREATNHILNEVDNEANGYILFGLGLGYHMQALAKVVGKDKPIYVCCFHKEEVQLYENSVKYSDVQGYNNLHIVTTYSELHIEESFQVILPQVWLQIIGTKHPLFDILMEIKTKQKTYKKYEGLLEENFSKNCLLSDFHLPTLLNEMNYKRLACLVSAGPSLNKTAQWLKNVSGNIYILCVGAALKPLLSTGIQPDAVIITDPQDITLDQVKDVKYSGTFFYLITANHRVVTTFEMNRCVLLQNGYSKSENLARETMYPTIDTGGSVATTAFSLLEYFGFEEIVLFGQDLGFKGQITHVHGSSSKKEIRNTENLLKVMSNSNELINTLPNLLSFRNWFERKILETNVSVYNTALHGAKIENVEVISETQFIALCEKYKN